MTLRILVALILGSGPLLAGSPGLLPGVVDTVGGTTFDNQNSGPSLRTIIADPEYGIHVSWMFSAEPYETNWPDRTMHYNFYDYSSGEWNWVDPDYMNSGLNCQSRRTGYGTLDIDPTDGAAMISAHYNAGGMPPQFAPVVARDLAPGIGVFDECVGEPTLTGYFLPVLGVDPDRNMHLVLIKFQATDNLYYARSTFWCNWEEPVWWGEGGAYGHNLTTSRASTKVIVTWMTGSNDSMQLKYRFSSDGGDNWGPVVVLDPPSAYGPDTMTVCARGASVIFDSSDDWLLTTTLLPAFVDTAYSNPAQLWMYNSGTSTWSRIHRAQSQTLAAGFGSHAAICDRPSLGQNPATGRLYAAWEQFDSMNVEPATNLLRADVWLAWSDDYGETWTDPVQLTEPDESSKRFPHLAANCSGDSIAVCFEQDLFAGFNSDSIGPVSDNPVCVWHGQVTGIAEQPGTSIGRLVVLPNPGSRFQVRLGNQTGELSILDVTGRKIRTLTARSGTCVWDGLDDRGHPAEPGCYLASWSEQARIRTEKLVLVRQ